MRPFARGSVLIGLVVSTPALACPVCGGGGRNQQAYIDMTVFLSLFPLAMLAFLVWVLWRNHQVAARQAEEADRAEEDYRAEGGPSSSTSSAAM